MMTDILKYWAKLNQEYNKPIIYDVEDAKFYILHSTLSDGWLLVSAIETPHMDESISKEGLYTINEYILKFHDISQIFSDVSGNFRKDSQNFNGISGNFSKDSKQFHKTFSEISLIASEIHARTANPKSASRVKARDYVQEAKLAIMQNDVYELSQILNRMNGLKGTLENLDRNKRKAAIRKYNIRMIKITVAVAFILGLVVVAVLDGIYKIQQRNINKVDVSQYSDEQIERAITNYANKIGVGVIYPYSRQKIKESFKKNGKLKQSIDSVLVINKYLTSK